MSEPSTIRVERPEPGVAILRLYRPDRLNALTKRALYAGLDTLLALALEMEVEVEVESPGQAFATGDPGIPAVLAAVREQLGHS